MTDTPQSFLRQAADYLYRAYGDRLYRFCIVFPNIRAGLFFKKYLGILSDEPVWSPDFKSLKALMEEITGFSEADRLSLTFDLYKAYRQHKPTNESFDDFYFWGEMLLDDFDEIDKGGTDARDLFRNVSDLKEIDQLFDYMTEEQKTAIRLFWQDFNDGNSGTLKAEFAAIWPSLNQIYETFKTRLKDKGFGYEGMIQREAVKVLREGHAPTTGYEKYVFIGFNALTVCEKYFFRHLQKSGRAIFFWDYDDYYVANHWHEAGIFMRDNIRSFPPEYRIDSRSLVDYPKQIETISVPSDTGQARIAGEILAQYPADTDWSRTALVLTDEHLLLPVLSVIPRAVKDINITMGYPFTYSPANSLFEHLARLQRNIRVYADGVRFYHQDVCAIMQHPYIQEIAREEARKTVQEIIAHNRIYVTPDVIPASRIFKLIFVKCANAKEFTAYLLSVVSQIVHYRSQPEPVVNLQDLFSAPAAKPKPGKQAHEQYQLEYLYTFYTALQRIQDVLIGDEIDMQLNTFCRLLRKIFASLKIPFNGEPLKGLQVMGILETRALDFDRVIILSMNEGVFPKASPKQSFIPYNLRKAFGLPVSERHDAISAYHFYRLIQRAADVRLIYNSAATDRNTGERSRYLSQLFYEPVFKVHERNITFHLSIESGKAIVKERSEAVQKALKNYYSKDGDGQRTLSPSALNSYLDCRLRFYFRYVEGLNEKEQVADEIDKSIFGKLLHKMMQLLYEPYVNQEINAGILTRIQKDKLRINQVMLRAFAEDYFYVPQVSNNDITGRNIIIREVLIKYVHRILEIDKMSSPFVVITLEKKLDVQIPVSNGSDAIMLNMGGYIDRLDDARDTLRIIDYKTGNATLSFKGIGNLFDRSKADNHAVMQTLTYARMVRQEYPQYNSVSPILYITKDLFKTDHDPRIHIAHQRPVENYSDVSEEFEMHLNELLSEMFLSDTPFTQTDDEKKCITCIYADICHRKHK